MILIDDWIWVHGQQKAGHVLDLLVKEAGDEKIILWDQRSKTRSETRSKIKSKVRFKFRSEKQVLDLRLGVRVGEQAMDK